MRSSAAHLQRHSGWLELSLRMRWKLPVWQGILFVSIQPSVAHALNSSGGKVVWKISANGNILMQLVSCIQILSAWRYVRNGKETQRKRIYLFIAVAECTLTSEFPFQTMSMIIKCLLLICLCLLTYNHRWSIYLFHRFIDLYSAELFAANEKAPARNKENILFTNEKCELSCARWAAGNGDGEFSWRF